MRLHQLQITAFRAFGAPALFDLDADVVLLSSRNGYGKSTVFDAIVWCLFDSVKRLAGSRDFSRAGASYLVNAFRRNEEPRVRLVLIQDGREVVVERSGSQLSILDGDASYEGDRAQIRLLEILGLPREQDESLTSLTGRAREAFNRSFLLHQDSLAEFVRSTNPRERFNAFATLFSVTEIRDFYTRLASERRTLGQELQGVASRLSRYDAELARLQRDAEEERIRIRTLAATSGRQPLDPITELDRRLNEINVLVPDQPWQQAARPLDKLDSAVLALRALTSRLANAFSGLEELASQIPMISEWEERLGNVTQSLRASEAQIQAAESAVNDARIGITRRLTELSELEQRLATESQVEARLHTFLEEAAQLITNDKCPVCERPYPQQRLVAALRSRIQLADPRVAEVSSQIRAAREALRVSRESERERVTGLERAQQLRLEQQAEHRELSRRLDGVRQAVARLGDQSPSSQLPAVIHDRISAVQRRLSEVSGQIGQLEALRSLVELVEGRERLSSLERGLNQQEARVEASRAEQTRLSAAGTTLDRMIVASQQAEREVVEELVAIYKEPIQRIYQVLSPHPLFRALDFEFDRFSESGELYFRASHDGVSINPAATFSASQANILALSVFLSLNSEQDWCPLSTMLIDDPVQHLDDVNILSFVDLLRQASASRQIMVSTSSAHLYRLMFDKLRPGASGQRLVGYRFEALTTAGPEIVIDRQEYTTPRPVLPDLLSRSA